MWEHFHHQADIGIRATGKSPEQAFQEAAVGLMSIICNTDTVSTPQQIKIECEAPDLELLLVDWLNALIYEISANSMLLKTFHVTLDNSHLTADVTGEQYDPEKHELGIEVKAATYAELKVKQQADNHWLVQCIVDV